MSTEIVVYSKDITKIPEDNFKGKCKIFYMRCARLAADKALRRKKMCRKDHN